MYGGKANRIRSTLCIIIICIVECRKFPLICISTTKNYNVIHVHIIICMKLQWQSLHVHDVYIYIYIYSTLVPTCV